MDIQLSARFVLVIFLVAGYSHPGAETITSSEYFPLADCTYWTYSVSDLYDNTYTTTNTVQPGITEVNQADTKALYYSHDKITEYFTSDTKDGILLHRASDPAPDEPSFTFEPPLIMAEPEPEIGSYINVYSGCTAQTVIPDIQAGPFPLSCNYTSYVVARETITVPTGEYDTVRLSFSLRIFGTLPTGTVTDETVNRILWVTQHIGPVKQHFSVQGDFTQSRTAMLTETNVGSGDPCGPPPEQGPEFMPWLPLLLE